MPLLPSRATPTPVPVSFSPRVTTPLGHTTAAIPYLPYQTSTPYDSSRRTPQADSFAMSTGWDVRSGQPADYSMHTIGATSTWHSTHNHPSTPYPPSISNYRQPMAPQGLAMIEERTEYSNTPNVPHEDEQRSSGTPARSEHLSLEYLTPPDMRMNQQLPPTMMIPTNHNHVQDRLTSNTPAIPIPPPMTSIPDPFAGEIQATGPWDWERSRIQPTIESGFRFP